MQKKKKLLKKNKKKLLLLYSQLDMGRFNIHAALAYTGIVAVAPVYINVWMMIRTATLPLPTRVYQSVNDALYVSAAPFLVPSPLSATPPPFPPSPPFWG